MDAIVVESLVKRYGHHLAVDGLDLTVPSGVVFGFLGPNGAGKTTTLRTMLDLIRPTSGRVSVLGHDARRDSITIRRATGYVPGDLAFDERLTGTELLTYLGSLRGGFDDRFVAELVERLDVTLDRPIRQLSRGNRQKLGLVQAFGHRPPLLLLDEPTAGLDPLVQQEFRALLGEARAAGQTVLLSSHVLSEVQHVADEVAVIRAGRLVAAATVDALRDRAPRRAEVVFAEAADANAFTARAPVRDASVDRDTLRCTLVGPVDAFVKALAEYTIVTLALAEPELEDVFVDLYRAAADDAALQPRVVADALS